MYVKPISKDVDMEHFGSSLKQLNQTFLNISCIILLNFRNFLKQVPTGFMDWYLDLANNLVCMMTACGEQFFKVTETAVAIWGHIGQMINSPQLLRTKVSFNISSDTRHELLSHWLVLSPVVKQGMPFLD